MADEKKKVSLQDLVNQKLRDKQQTQTNNNNATGSTETQRMRSQQASRKATFSRRKMGG